MAYYEHNFKNVLYRMRSNYALSSPNKETKQYYHDKIMEYNIIWGAICLKISQKWYHIVKKQHLVFLHS